MDRPISPTLSHIASAEHQKFPTPLGFWLVAFLYSVFLALVLQKLVLPLLPELHAGHGLFKNDAFVFHEQAAAIAMRIKEVGWSAWSFFPHGGTGNVGLLSALYAIGGADPAYFVPFNAAAHATGAVYLYRIGPLLWPGRPGALGGLIAGILFLVFPSALQWYGQNLKDAFAIAGFLMMMHAWLGAVAGALSLRGRLSNWLTFLAGALLFAAVRPYFTVVVALAFALAWGGLLAWSCFCGQLRTHSTSLAATLLLVCTISGLSALAKHTEMASGVYERDGATLNITVDDSNSSGSSSGSEAIAWNTSELVPVQLDHAIRRATELRAHFIDFNRQVAAGSAIDADRLPTSAWEFVAYVPRALAVGMLAPFPSTWGEKVSAPRLIGAIETSLWYLFLPGLILFVVRRPNRGVFSGLLFCAVILVLLSYIHPNVGTLYRQRFGFWMFLLLCGSVGWASVLAPFFKTPVVQAGGHQTARSAASFAASGALVVAITFMCYLGFMTRDLLMVAQFGMESKLDTFFAAAMLPMFFVAFLAMPFADALTLPLVHAKIEQWPKIVHSVLKIACLVLGFATVTLVVTADYTARLILSGADAIQLSQAASMLRWFSPIVFLSGWTVIGNAVLNTLHQSRPVALAQLIVPVCAVGAILVAPVAAGPYAAILGMLVGTAANLLVLIYLCWKAGIWLMPFGRTEKEILRPILQNYRWLLLIAIFAAASTPINFMFAGSVDAGAVSAWAISGKLMQLITGLVSVGVGAVLLPHVARLVAGSDSEKLKRHLYPLLVVGSWVGGLLALAVFEFASPLAGLVYSSSAALPGKIEEFANILRIAALQLPAVICAAMLLKLAAVSGASSKAVISTAIGLLLNVVFNLIWVPSLGVLGVALGSLIASTLAAAILLCWNGKLAGLHPLELVALLVSWLIWWCVCMVVHMQNIAVILCVPFFLLGLAAAQRAVARIKNGGVGRSLNG